MCNWVAKQPSRPRVYILWFAKIKVMVKLSSKNSNNYVNVLNAKDR